MADNDASVSASITAEDTFTDWLIVNRAHSPGQRAFFSVLVQGSFTATVSVQYKRPTDDDSDAVDDDITIDEPKLHNGEIVGVYYVRAGVKSGDFTSGTVEVEVARI